MQHRRILSALLGALLLMALAACGGTSTQSQSPGPSQPAAATAPASAPAGPTSAPAAQPTGDATASVPTSQPATDAAGPTAAPSASAGVRTFKIVPEQSEASYEVQEQFLNRNLPNMAVGKTSAIEGELQLSLDGQPTGKVTRIAVDLRTLTSDSPRRDGRIRSQWLESDKYPYAEFTSTAVQGAPTSYADGQEVSFKLIGDMKIRDVTRPVTFDVTGKLAGDTIAGTATTKIMMKDFGFEPPSIAGVLTVQDGVTIKVNFTAKQV